MVKIQIWRSLPFLFLYRESGNLRHFIIKDWIHNGSCMKRRKSCAFETFLGITQVWDRDLKKKNIFYFIKDENFVRFWIFNIKFCGPFTFHVLGPKCFLKMFSAPKIGGSNLSHTQTSDFSSHSSSCWENCTAGLQKCWLGQLQLPPRANNSGQR